jgi:cell division protein FtsQ
MKVAGQTGSFTAYSNTRDLPRGAVSTKKSRQEIAPPGKGKVGILSLVLLACLAVLFNQHKQEVFAYISKPVDKVLIENALVKFDEGRLRNLLAEHMNVGFFVLDVTEIKRALESDAWVDRATVSLIWPDTLSVAITEEVAIARWGGNNLLNQYGKAFTPRSVSAEIGLPLLNGPENSQDRVMEQYQVLSQMLSGAGLRISELALSERGSWDLRLDNNIQVTIGRSDVVNRVQRLITLYERHLIAQVNEIEALDLRYNNGVSVKKRADLNSGIAAK